MPKCGKLKARRMIGGGAFILKGGGWESDLYSGPSNRSASPAKKSDDSSKSSSPKSNSSPPKSDSSSKAND